MNYLRYAFCCFLSIAATSFSLPVASEQRVVLHDKTSFYSFTDKREYYVADGKGEVSLPSGDLEAFLSKLKRVSDVDKVSGGEYWLYEKFKNDSSSNLWVLEPFDSIIDTLHIYIYHDGSVKKLSSGFLGGFNYNLSYAVDVIIPQGDSFEVLIYVKSRYFSGSPNIELKPAEQFLSWLSTKNSIMIACFGAIFVLACYNFILGFWIRDKSNLYYSCYLVMSIVAWLGAFNAFSDWFSWQSYWLLIPPFFLTVVFNTLYFIHFLDLPTNEPKLTRYLYLFIVVAILCSVLMPLFSMGQYMLLYGFVTNTWLVLALYCGYKRLFEGYKPARFFVLAFTVLAIGIVTSAIPIFFPGTQIKHHYLLTLVTQTIDMLLLSLALADRINILRVDREAALSKVIKTESWANQKEKEANTKLQQALQISEDENQRKSDFLRMVSHELRTPLYSIISSVEQWDEIESEEGQKDLLTYMSYGAARLRMQVDNLVLLAETDNEDLQVTKSPFEIRPLLDSLCENIRGLLNPGVAFSFKCSDDVPVSFSADAYLLEHMLRTILENACKYTENGKVDFFVRWDEQESLYIEINDSGCGMTREQQRVMFNDFVQVSRGLERKSEGLGIGLTVCYRLSELLGADLNIQSQVGKGTEVILNIPLEVVGQPAVPSSPESIQHAAVLIVEDNVVNAKILQSLVRLIGGEAVVVESGQDALKLIDERGFDIVLMDIQMPVMDGITATRWIRRRNHFMPVVAVSANSDAAVRARCVEVGMNDFLAKPIKRSDLQRVMERQLFSGKPF